VHGGVLAVEKEDVPVLLVVHQLRETGLEGASALHPGASLPLDRDDRKCEVSEVEWIEQRAKDSRDRDPVAER
jgi:hypothetical protein